MDFLLNRFKEGGEKTAFVFNGSKSSYNDILANIDVYSDLIKQKGIKSGEVVLLVGDYSPNIFCFILALARNNNIVAPLTHDSVVELSKVLDLSEAAWVVRFSLEVDKIHFEKTETVAVNSLTVSLVDKNEPGLILFSSGSTGKPKGMLLNFNTVLKKFEKAPRKGVTAIVFLMLDHFGGINTLLGITSSLGTVVTISERSVVSVCEAIEKNKVELLPTTPSFLNMLVASNVYKEFDLSSLKKITYGTEVMSQATLAKIQKAFPAVVLQQTYGLSELGVLSSKSRDDGSLWVKVGGDGFALKVVDDILWIKSEYAMLGYLNAPNPFDADGWFNTQDKVEVDGEWIKILGRTTDLINIGGQKVYPSEIENVIINLDNIEDVSVYSESNPLLGRIVCAKVRLASEEPLASLKTRIRIECAKQLSSFKVPTKITIATEDLYSPRMKKIRTHV